MTTLTTAGATPHTQRPTRPSRRRSATRTTRRAASSSTPRRLSKSRSRSVSNPSSRTATPLGPRCAGISSTVLGMQMRRRLSWAVNICEQICFRPSSIRRPESLRTFAAKPFMDRRGLRCIKLLRAESCHSFTTASSLFMGQPLRCQHLSLYTKLPTNAFLGKHQKHSVVTSTHTETSIEKNLHR